MVSSTPRPCFTPGKDPVPIVQEAGWAPPGFDPRTVQPVAQSLYRLSYFYDRGIHQLVTPQDFYRDSYWIKQMLKSQSAAGSPTLHPIHYLRTCRSSKYYTIISENFARSAQNPTIQCSVSRHRKSQSLYEGVLISPQPYRSCLGKFL